MKLSINYHAQRLGSFYRQIAKLRLHYRLRYLLLLVVSAGFSPLALLAQTATGLNTESSGQVMASVPISSSSTSSNSNLKHNNNAKNQNSSSINAGNWETLDKRSQQFLSPLKSVWQDLSTLQQRKWVAIAVQSRKMPAAEVLVLQQRMRDWSLLSSYEREKARINFNKVNQLSAEQKLKNWQAYQALSEQDKALLSKKTVIQKGLALQNASTAVQSKNKLSGIHIIQSPSPQHPSIANSNLNISKETKTTELKAKIQAGTLLPETSTP